MRRIHFIRAISLMAAVAFIGAGFTAAIAAVKKKSTLRMESPSFNKGQAIPDKYTCAGANVSPAIHWKGAPPKTKTFALICEDPDAPMQTWVHWVIFNIPVTTNDPTYAFELTEGYPRTETQTNGIVQGTNDFKKIGYDGPCPPAGSPHRYYFELYALDSSLPLGAGAMKSQVMGAMKGHILDQTQIMGTYGKK